MMRLFARRKDSRSSPEPQTGSAPRRAADRSGRRARRRTRPEAEALDSRLLMASGNLGMADATAPPDLSDRVARALQPYFAQDRFPGISVAIVTDGQVALAQGYGISNVATGSHVQANTRFDIGSVTKTFTALGVLLLYQESQGTSHPLNLDAPISQYLHDNKSFRLPPKWSQVTTRELLAMTSGIRDVGSARPWQAQLESIAKDPLLYAPGTESSYSNTNYDLLGQLIEQWTGETYGTFLEDQILEPLGMSETQELGQSATVPNQAVGYDAPRHGRWPRAEVQNGPALYAAAGMVSTAQDMANYMTALLSERILKPATYALMWTSVPTPQYGVKPSSSAERGLGWDTVIHRSDGSEEVTKGGQVPGYSSELVLDPTSDSGVFVSFNTNFTGSRNPNGVTALQVARSVYKATKTSSSTGG
ncbi:MAG: serine hydrolase domain-containing protein [Isosphaeraceae bacterium]|jgi:CubicO group peptidase (beta-lactamase class C family)